MNPGPVNAYMLLQSRLAQRALSILDVGGAGDCFFRVISHQLYGESSYHMNIRNVGVNYMRNNPERFIESNTEDSWASYLASKLCHSKEHGLMHLYPCNTSSS